MNFQDYGIVNWFDETKGFGMVSSVHNGDVFIHTNNDIVVGLKPNSHVLIKEIVMKKGKCQGIGITFWHSHSDQSIFDAVFDDWANSNNLSFDDRLDWLINFGGMEIVEKIIMKNYTYWLTDTQFINKFNDLHVATFDKKLQNFIFDVWKQNKENGYNKNVKWLLENADLQIVNQLLTENYENWCNYPATCG